MILPNCGHSWLRSLRWSPPLGIGGGRCRFRVSCCAAFPCGLALWCRIGHLSGRQRRARCHVSRSGRCPDSDGIGGVIHALSRQSNRYGSPTREEGREGPDSGFPPWLHAGSRQSQGIRCLCHPESPRLSRRPFFLRGYSDGKTNQIRTGSSATRRTDGVGQRGPAQLAVVNDHLNRQQDWLHAGDAAQLGPSSGNRPG